MRRRLARLLLAALALTAVAVLPAPAADAAPEAGATGCGIGRAAGTRAHTVRAAGLTRTYHLTVPRGYRGDTRVPLVVDLHGAGSNAQQQAVLSRARQEAAERGWIVATPDAGRAFWYLQARGGEDVTFLQKVVQDVARRLCIHPGRRFVMGMSNGAAMSSALTCALPNTFAAAAAVGGVNIAGTCTERPRPIVAFHGTGDPTVPYGGGPLGGRVSGLITVPPVLTTMGQWAIRNGCGGPVVQEQVVPTIARFSWPDCDEPVELYRVLRGGHTWPGGPTLPPSFGPTSQAIDATQVIFDAFARTFAPT